MKKKCTILAQVNQNKAHQDPLSWDANEKATAYLCKISVEINNGLGNMNYLKCKIKKINWSDNAPFMDLCDFFPHVIH